MTYRDALIVEIIGALVSILIIWILTAILVYTAAMRIVQGDFKSIAADPMLYTSCAGVVFNIMSVIFSLIIFL